MQEVETELQEHFNIRVWTDITERDGGGGGMEMSLVFGKHDGKWQLLIEVHHSRVKVTLDAKLTCDKPIQAAGTFPTMVIDTYSDRAGRQWRNRVTYPDGTTRDTVATGSAVYPTGVWERGEYRGSTLGCVGPNAEPFILGAEPGQGGLYILTLADELAADERPYVLLFADIGTRVTGDHVDDNGRSSELWEQRVDGFAGYGEPVFTRAICRQETHAGPNQIHNERHVRRRDQENAERADADEWKN